MATKKSSSKGVPAGALAAGAVAAAAAAGTAYYFYGSKKAKAHRRKAATWANGLKREVIKDAKKVQKLTGPTLAAIVDRAADAYKMAKDIDPAELRAATNELKRNWKMVAKELKDAGSFARGTKKAPKKSAKKPAKKRATKATKKRR